MKRACDGLQVCAGRLCNVLPAGPVGKTTPALKGRNANEPCPLFLSGLVGVPFRRYQKHRGSRKQGCSGPGRRKPSSSQSFFSGQVTHLQIARTLLLSLHFLGFSLSKPARDPCPFWLRLSDLCDLDYSFHDEMDRSSAGGSLQSASTRAEWAASDRSQQPARANFQSVARFSSSWPCSSEKLGGIPD
jgi:hypothetical protein